MDKFNDLLKKCIKEYKIGILAIITTLFFGIFLIIYIYKTYELEPQISYYIFLSIIISGFLISLFYGWKAVPIFRYIDKDKKLPEYSNSWQVHQFWLNFIGSLVGWFLIVLFIYILKKINIDKITITHLLVLLLGIIGITGLLPAFINQIINILHWINKI